MKKYITALLIVATFFTSCYKDKDEFKELAEITVEGIPEVIHLIRKVDRLVVTPKIISSKEGEIKGDNPNYSFRYRLAYSSKGYLGGEVDGKGQPWIDLTPANGFNLDIPIDFEANSYVCWFTITDKRNNRVHSHLFDIQVSTLTYQGWIVLSNMGPEERVRLDMISHVSSTRTELLYDLAVGLPQIHHGTQLSMIPDNFFADEISIFSKEGSYVLNNSTLESKPVKEFNKTTFFDPPAERMIATRTFVTSGNDALAPNFHFVISDAGNAYVRKWPTGQRTFTTLFNKAGVPQLSFKVAPFIAFGEMRPGNNDVAIFYDRDNKRFMQVVCGFRPIIEMSEIPIPSASPNLFPYKTGKDMVYMEGTRRSNGMINAILQDAQGKRSIYGMRVSGTANVVQDYYIENVTAPGFEQAKLFAFDSQFPYLFYAVGNKVYLYVLSTGTVTEVANITGEITALKYNLYRMPDLSSLNNQSTQFMNQQFQLIVGTFDSSVANGNGGKVAFYEVDGRTSTVNKLHEYGGFGKVKDVVYRERFK